jgi:hypothetical protein
MLGWGFTIQLLSNKLLSENSQSRMPPFAKWQASLGGTDWIEALVKKGLADKLFSDGYPNSYLLRASTLLEILEDGVPDHSGPTVIGDDYVLEGGWKGKIGVDVYTLMAYPPSSWIIVDAWDLS